MKYFGGKFRISKNIVSYFKSLNTEYDTYIEPFVGGAWMLKSVHDAKLGFKYYMASDLHQDLICMYLAIKKGWLPPKDIDLELYHKAKNNQVSPELRAFVGFGCSFGGKWFDGLARGGESKKGVPRNYATNAYNSLYKKKNAILNTNFFHTDYYKWLAVCEKLCNKNILLYCDPPYADTRQYNGISEKFNHDKFWQWCRDISAYASVFVSEYKAPDDFECVLEINTKTDMRDSNQQHIKRTEKLFTYNKERT